MNFIQHFGDGWNFDAIIVLALLIGGLWVLAAAPVAAAIIGVVAICRYYGAK